MQDKLEALKKELLLKGKVVVKVIVQTNKPKTKLIEVDTDGALKVHLKAEPVNNMANRELQLFVSNLFDVHRDNVSIIKGLSSKHKFILVQHRVLTK